MWMRNESGASRASGTAMSKRTGPSGEYQRMPAPTPVFSSRPAKLSKEAYRRQKAAVDGELTRLGLRKNHLELAMGDPTVAANFVELRRISSELADISTALEAAEEAWLELEERAP